MSKKNDFLTTAGAGIAGMAVGAIVGSALANKESREKLKDTGSKLMKKVDELKNKSINSLNDAEEVASKMKEQAKEEYEATTKKADEFLAEKKEEFAEAKKDIK